MSRAGKKIAAVSEMHFGMSEVTMWHLWSAANPLIAKMMTPEDLVLFRSKTGSQVIFVSPPINDGGREVWYSQKLRMPAGELGYDNLMRLADQVGIKLSSWAMYKKWWEERNRLIAKQLVAGLFANLTASVQARQQGKP